MNMGRKLFAGPLLCMLALSVVFSSQASMLAPAGVSQAETAPTDNGQAETPPTDGGGRAASAWADCLKMDVSYGYENHARGGRYVPVDMVLDNQGTSDFDGFLDIMTMESDYDIYQYQYPVTVTAGAKTSRHVYIPIGNRADQMFVSVSDDRGKSVLRRRVKLDFGIEAPELFVGILSDTPERLSAWDGLSLDYNMLKTTAIHFKQTDFPTDEMGLDMLDVILISNFRIRNLSAEQSRTLIQWVRGGGIMILGTGMRADDTLGRFAPELLEESYDPPKEREVDMGAAYAADEPSDSILALPCVDFSLAGGEVILSDEEQTLAAAVTYGKGTIAVAAYDFADINEFCEKNPSYLDNLLTEILGEDRIGKLAQSVYSGNSDQYWAVRDMIDTGDVRRLPNLTLYAVEIIIYIFLVGLALYVFLKQRDMTELYRSGVAVLSVFFTVIIYFASRGTRFTDTFYTYARFLETTAETVSETTYVNVRAPYNRPYEMELAADCAVKPVTRGFYSADGGEPVFTGSEDYRIRVSRMPEKTVVAVRDVPAFEPRYFQLNKTAVNEEGVGFYGELELERGNISGSVTNQFTEAVENAALLFNNKLICLGRMEPGETVSVDQMEMVEYPQAHSYQVAAYLSGKSGFDQADISNEEYVEAAEKTNLLEFYLDNFVPYYTTPGVRVVGVMDDGDDPGSLLSADLSQGITLVSSTVAIYPRDDEVIYRSALAKNPRVAGGSYDRASNSLYGVDPVTLEYSLGNDVYIETLFFDNVSEIFTKGYGGDQLVSFRGSIYFYNHNTGTFDEMDPGKTEYEDFELAGYLSPGNTLTVRYVYDDLNRYNWNVMLPALNIVGREY